MSLLDRFRKQPAPPRAASGNSGRGNIDGFLRLEELNADLRGQLGLQVYDRMYRTDGDVRRAMSMICNPIVAGDWAVEPYGGDNATDRDREIAEAVEWMAFENMQPGFTAHLAEALPVFLRSGFCPFEQMWGTGEYVAYEPNPEGGEPAVTTQTLLAPRKLGLRLPRSIWRWMQDDDGELTSLWQMIPAGPRAGMVELPAENLIYYRVGAEGDNWEGVSLLRPAYKHWYLKDKIERLDALAQEREALGLPVVFPPSNAKDSAELDALEASLQAYRAGDAPYLIMPGPEASSVKEADGWGFRIEGFASGQGGRDPMPSLNYHSDKIASTFVEEFMRLAQSGSSGARALGETQQEPFEEAVNAVAGIVADQWNFSLIPRFVALNFPDAQGCPSLAMSQADAATLSELGTYVQGLMGAEAIHPDDELEDDLRARADLPPANPDARELRKAQELQDRELSVQGQQAKITQETQPQPAGGNGGDGGDGGPPAQHSFARQTRDLRPYEQQMALDAIEQAIDGARQSFQTAGASAARAYAATVAQQVANEQTPDSEPPAELTAAIERELHLLHATGRQTVVDELNAQRGATPSQAYTAVLARAQVFADQQPDGSITARAALAARVIAQRIVTAITRLFVGGSPSLAQLQQAGEQEAQAGLKAEAQLNAAAALNEGRDAQAQQSSDEIAGAYYTSILDGNRCDPCAQADDDVLRPLDDPVLMAEKPPNPACQGGGRCRCMLFYRLRGETSPSV